MYWKKGISQERWDFSGKMEGTERGKRKEDRESMAVAPCP